MPGKLFVVATPIGNLEDITLRAIRILNHADFIAAEDTRHSGQLLAHLKIAKKPYISYQEHNEDRRIPEIMQKLIDGNHIALISDAGTPAMSDPGFRLIRACIAEGIEVEIIPGASSILTALVGSGLPTDSFYFGGFLPRTPARRQRLFGDLAELPSTLVFFESPHRIGAALQSANNVLGNRQAVVARELTKMHEQFDRGSLLELSTKYNQNVKGEIVLLIAGRSRKEHSE